MYWLLSQTEQKRVREEIGQLVNELAPIIDNPHDDQLFPYVGRKDRRKARVVIERLSSNDDVVVEPFTGSGSIAYAALDMGRKCVANDWEPYVNRMASAPWRLPARNDIDQGLSRLLALVKENIDELYKTKCECGNFLVFDSLFFDRVPYAVKKITPHERLGPNGENITYRKKYKCPHCGRTEKFFDEGDQKHLEKIEQIALTLKYKEIFSSKLIENSRINLSSSFTIYGNLFPHRSQVALAYLWDGIQEININENTRLFFEDAFLSILPQAKYKDYRSKSQDLHVPEKMLREVNLLNRLIDQLEMRFRGISAYSFSTPNGSSQINCSDFREFLGSLEKSSAGLIVTDPPWTDGNAYFEKAQLYHPWIGYNLSNDSERLAREFVVTDAPTRKSVHNLERWWKDLDEFFEKSDHALRESRYLALYFRPIPASSWLHNLNKLKLSARKNGFEPLLSIDVASSDPSMRIQQSAAYVFSKDIIFVFIKIPNDLRRLFVGDIDIDQLVYKASEDQHELDKGPYMYKHWRSVFAKVLSENGVEKLNAPENEETIHRLFQRYNDEVQPGQYLPKPLTPFSGQLFDTPAEERLFTYVPIVIQELTLSGDTFSYDQFLLKLAQYLENGTRALIEQVQDANIKKLIDPYAEVVEDGKKFKKRELPKLPEGINNILQLDPYVFEAFVGKLFEAQGYTSVVLVGRSGDRGVDLLAKDPNGESVVIQCKRYLRNNVSSEPVQRLHSFSITRGAKRRILVTTSDFTRDALDEARITNTELINQSLLEGLIAKFLPDFFHKNIK